MTNKVWTDHNTMVDVKCGSESRDADVDAVCRGQSSTQQAAAV